jgi:hypothetical protein
MTTTSLLGEKTILQYEYEYTQSQSLIAAAAIKYLEAGKRTSEDINEHSEKERITQNSKP